MFSLEQKIFIMQCYFRNGERFENGEWSYSTPRFFDEFQQMFSGFSKHLPTTCPESIQMRQHFLKTGSLLCKKSSGRPTKRTAENIEEVEQRIAETPNKSIGRINK
jgi:hypothetical protein